MTAVNAKPRNLLECFTERMLTMPEPLCPYLSRQRGHVEISQEDMPVVSNRDHVLDTLLIEDVYQILPYCGMQKVGRVGGLGFCSSVSDKVRNDQPISLWLEIIDLVVPVI